MGPLKALLPFAKGFLRFTVLIFALVFYFDKFRHFEFRQLDWLIAIAFIIAGFLLFIGEFTKRPTLSIIAGFAVLALSGYELFRHFKGFDNNLSLFLFPAAIGLYFIARGNKG